MSKRQSKSRKRRGLHGPSVLTGFLLGAGGVGLVALAPGFLSDQFAKLPVVTPGQDDLDVVFEFDELLRQSEVPVNPGSYADPAATGNTTPVQPDPGDAAPSATPWADEAGPSTAAPATATRIYIQAASFRDATEADQLRAKLLLHGLPVNMEQVDLENRAWHRVMVGPVESATEAQKIVDRLHEQNLSAITVKRG